MERSSLVNEVRQLRALAADRVQEAREVQDESRVLVGVCRALRSEMQEVRSINAERNWWCRQNVRRSEQRAHHARDFCLHMRSTFGLIQRSPVSLDEKLLHSGRRSRPQTYLRHER
jgi:hypothetical protein